MKELIGTDLFDLIPQADAICITTNCTLGDDGSNPMGGGCAGVASRKWPSIEYIYGDLIRAVGHVPVVMGYVSKSDTSRFFDIAELSLDETEPGSDWCAVVAYPTMHEIGQQASLELVERSAALLAELALLNGWETVYVPRPGAGIGGLDWDAEVKPTIESILGDEFILVHKEFARPSFKTWTSTEFDKEP